MADLFTFEQVFAVDPGNQANVAANASVLIFAPGDSAKTPLTITTPDGAPLANPLQVNANGFGSAFAHTTLDRVAWEGGGFTGFFTSYEGMKQVALDARAAAESAASNAGAAAVGEYMSQMARGTLPSGADFNTYNSTEQVGTYSVSSGGAYQNGPNIPSSGTFELVKTGGTSLAVLQRVTCGSVMVWREAVDVAFNTWSDWVQAETTAGTSQNLTAAKAYADSAFTPLSRGVLADGTDLNTLIGAAHVGAYGMLPGNTYLNAPELTSAATLEVQRGSGGTLAVVHRITAGNVMMWREAADAAAGFWSAWEKAETASTVDAKLSARGPAWAPTRNVPGAADMNTYTTPGISRISTPDTATILNLPPGMRTAGEVENITTGTGTDVIFAQRVVEVGDSGRTWWRTAFPDGTGFTPWAFPGVAGAPVAEWHVFLAAGQSNMSGRGVVTAAAGGKYAQPRIAQFGAVRRVIETATIPLDMHDTASGLSPASVFARNYLRTQPDNVGILIIPAAHGATGFTTSTSSLTWTPNTATDPALDLPALAVKQAKDGIAAAQATGASVTLKGVLWHQGENNSSMSTATYAANLDALISYFRAQLGDATLPFIVGQMVPEGIAATTGRANIDAAHQQTPGRVPYTGFAPATTGGYNPGDTTHMSKKGLDFLGRTYLEAYEQVKVASPALAAVPGAVSKYINEDPTVVQAAADLAANNADLVAKWKPNTAYTAGQQVVSPDGDNITRTIDGTTGAAFTMTNWAPSATAAALPGKLDASQKGAASGVAGLDAQGKVPASQGSVGLPADQLDYVAALALRSKATKLQMKKNGSTNEVEVSCLTPSGNHVTYQFYGSAAGDDYRVLANVWAGTSTATTAQTVKRLWADVTTTGTYTAATGAFVYTTDKATPATFTATVTVDVDGSDLRFHTYRDNRGGLWELKISGPATATVNVSTYAATAAYNTTGNTVITNLRPGTYTVVGKFLGDDPANIPSGGAGTARGWLANNADASSSSATLLDVYAPFRQVNKDILLKPASNMDIAMQVKPAGGSTLEWMPYHGVATMYLADAPVYLDGDTVIDVAGMATGGYRALNSFELVQRVNGRNSETGATNLVELATSHSIRPSGQVTVTGRWKALQNIELGDNYHMMLPAGMAVFDLLVSSLGNGYRNGTDMIGTETALAAENDTAMSYLFLASTNKNVGAAVRYTNPQETIRRGKDRKNPDSTKAFLQHRDANIVKVYNRPYAAGTAVTAGTVQRFSGDYLFIQATGLYDQYAL